ncbi:glycosyltransferase family 4 protein [Haloarcula sp. JP-L23]|uniref:glycosyltransferase family 4 protein n=1 Tax=Haloarcula sp. JP-L23 TaxID=2716717 RepID=UPI00140EFD1D|nr:glycosyltransferase family 4 protein [Haloarcula sp. JP-L23]
MDDGETEYLLVTEYFHPDTASTGQLLTELAVGLEDRGLDMTVYTGQPNYHSGENEMQPLESVHEGVLVKRIRAPQLRQSSLARRLFNWVVFSLWMFVTLLLSRTHRPRELVFVSNPPFLPIVLWPVCWIRGWEFTYIVHDLYPDQPVELGYIRRGGVIDVVWSELHRHVFHAADHVVALGPVMKEQIVRNANPGFKPSKVEIIHNWEDEEFIEPVEKENNPFSEKHDLIDPFTVIYSGNIGEFHDLETIVKAAKRLEDDSFRLLIIGEGDNKPTIVSLAEQLDIAGDTVRFLPYQPHEDLPYSLTSGDVSLVTIQQGFEGVCVSSKLYTALAAGLPVLCIAQPTNDEAKIISQADAGLTVPQGDVDGVVSAIERWIENPDLVSSHGKNARQTFEARFTKRHSVDKYYRLLS